MPELEQEKQCERTILSIDPSINDMGYAVTTERIIVVSGTVISATKDRSAPLAQRIQRMLKQLDTKLVDTTFDTIIIEEPKRWGGEKSMGSSNSGDLITLSLMVGGLTGWFYAKCPDKCLMLVTATGWKGTVTKNVTERKVQEYYGYKAKTSHEADAIGIGMYAHKVLRTLHD